MTQSIITNAANHNSKDSTPSWMNQMFISGLVFVALVGLLSWFTISAAHINDRYMVDQSSGTWIALAWNAQNGALYPPLYDGEYYGGTRYMPIYILLHAGTAHFTNEYLISGKIVVYAAAVALLTVLFLILRRHQCGALISIALTASFVMSMPAFYAIYSIRGDGLGLLFPLIALMTINNSSGWRAAVIAALFCALGVLSKVSAIWAPAAIVFWLGYVSIKRCLIFGGVTFVATLMLCIATDLLSDGRLRENMFASSLAGIDNLGSIFAWSPQRIADFLIGSAPVCIVLIPVAILSIFRAIQRREFSVFHIGFLCQIPLLFVLFSDIGVGENHLIEVLALTIILTGEFCGRERSIHRDWSSGLSIIAVAVVWVNAVSFIRYVAKDFWDAGIALMQRTNIEQYSPDPLRGFISEDDNLLTEDPYLSVLLKKRPLVLDSFSIRRFDATHPEWVDELIARIDKRDFDKIVLTQDPDPESWWYDQLFFGQRVIRSILSNYTQTDQVGDYHVFVPSPVEAPP